MTLPVARTLAGRQASQRLLAEPHRALIAMDFDGTLAPIVADPQAARAHPGAARTLRRLAPNVGKLAVVTGRPAAIAVDYGDLAGVAGLVVLGHYGLERWESGTLRTPQVHDGIEAARERLSALLAEDALAEGAVLEDKRHALAVHVRRARDPQQVLDALEGRVREVARDVGLAVEPGRMVLELRPRGADKGGALRELVGELSAHEPLSVVVFIGDDLGDLAAFDEVERLRLAGVPGLLVCSESPEAPAVAARADVVVDGPAGVVTWLEELAAAVER